MIEVIQLEDLDNSMYILTVIVPFKDIADIKLDNIDSMALNSEIKSPADVLQNLQILAFRLEQQKDKE